MSGGADIVRRDWGNDIVPSESAPVNAVDALQRGDPATDIAVDPTAMETAERIEAGLMANELATVNGAIEHLSEPTRQVLHDALSRPPLAGREDSWLKRLQGKLTLQDAVELRAVPPRCCRTICTRKSSAAWREGE